MTIQNALTLFILLCGVLTQTAHGSDARTRPAGENHGSPQNACHTIGNYQICPGQKAVKVLSMTGGVNWDGVTYVQSDTIVFDSTEMYIIGNSILFKEQAGGKDMQKAHVLHPQKYSLNHPGIPLVAFDNDSIYSIGHQSILPVADIEDKKVLRDDIFIDRQGRLYVLQKHNTGALLEIPASRDIDKDSIRHLVDNYYYDKNRIYLLDYSSYMEGGRQMSGVARVLGEYEDRNFHVGASYFTVDDRVYLRSDGSVIPLEVDASAVEEYLLDAHYMTYLITDGERAYIHSRHYQGTKFRELTSLRGLRLQGILSGTRVWKYDSRSRLVYLDEPARLSTRNIKAWQGQLMISQTDYKAYIVDRDGTILSFNGIMLWGDRGPLRDLGVRTERKTMTGTALLAGYSFDNASYAVLMAAFSEKGIAGDNLVRVGETIFFTDGKHLVLMDEIWQENQTYGEDGSLRIGHSIDGRTCSINRPDSVKILNDDILTDGATLYYRDRNRGTGKELRATAVADLGIAVFYAQKGKGSLAKAH